MHFGGVHIEKAVRRKFTDGFKEGAVRLVTDQGYKISEAARNLGIHMSYLDSIILVPEAGVGAGQFLASQQPDGRGWPKAIVLRNRVRQAILNQLAEPDLAGEFTSLLQMEIDRSQDKSE